jgi:SAM-dependent methyltransferase
MAEYVVEFGKDGSRVEPDGRLDAAAFHRNHQPIWRVLERFLRDKSGDVVEAGSGTGQHVVEFARHAPRIVWWPSDLNDRHLQSIRAWRSHTQLANIREPSGPGKLLAVFCANVIHIAPWRVAEGLIAGTSRYLRPDGRLFIYGPFKRDGRHTAVSNAVFDTSLRDGNPEWGLRDVEAVGRLAEATGLALVDIAEMPSNNLVLVLARS